MKGKAIIAVALFFLLEANTGRAIDVSIAQLIEQVRNNEEHYANIDLAFQKDYRKFEPALEADAIPSEEDCDKWLSSEFQLLLQEGRFRLERTTQSRLGTAYAQASPNSPNRLHTKSRAIQTYDGRNWRSYTKSRSWPPGTQPEDADPARRSGLISTDEASLFNFSRPHMFMLESGCPQVPLSVYLSGHRAVRAWPNSDMDEGCTLSISYLGQEKFRGLTCQKVLIDTYLPNGNRHNGWEMWLAEERNCIPARMFGYTYGQSKELPVAESTIDKWKEVKPEIWFPVAAHTSRYQSDTIRRQGKQKVSWTKDLIVTRVALEPVIDQSAFRELEFPSGTEVRVEEEGQLTKSFVQK